MGVKTQDKFLFWRVAIEVSAIVVRPSNLPYKKENFQNLMNIAQGSCGKLERAMTMELELLESQLFPLLTV